LVLLLPLLLLLLLPPEHWLLTRCLKATRDVD
jgi:hypothetical protein